MGLNLLTFTENGTTLSKSQVDKNWTDLEDEISRIGGGIVRLTDYIPVSEHTAIYAGTSTYDCATAIATAMTYATTTNSVLEFPRGLINTSAPIVVTTSTRGHGFYPRTMIKAIAGSGWFPAATATLDLPAVMSYRVANARHDGYTINGNNIAAYDADTRTAALSTFYIDCWRARIDGFHGAASGNNNNVTLQSCQFRENGTTYSSIIGFDPGNINKVSISGNTVSGASGGTVLTITGGWNPSTLSTALRPNIDIVKINGVGSRIIASVTSTTITINETLPSTVTNATFAVLQGNGQFVEFHSDNNSWSQIGRCTYLSNACCGRINHALYGSTDVGSSYEFAGSYDAIIGQRFPPNATYGEVLLNPYNEGGLASEGAFWFTNAQASILSFPQVIGTTARCKYNAAANVKVQDVSDRLQTIDLTGLGATAVNITASLSLFNQSAGGANVTVILPNAPIDTQQPEKYTFALGAMNGKTFTVTTPSAGVLVNGVAGTTGVTFSGNYKVLNAIWSAGAVGWIVA